MVSKREPKIIYGLQEISDVAGQWTITSVNEIGKGIHRC